MPDQSASPDSRLKIFISYSRADTAFAEELVAGLEMQGFAISIDRHSIAAGEDWKKRLGNLILGNDTVVFVISPNSVSSDICQWEVEESARLAKRILPVICSPVDFKGKIPPLLQELNSIPMNGGKAISGLKQLVEALNTDVEWLREHTRYTERADEWDHSGRGEERLLRGDALAKANEWLGRRVPTAPEPTTLQRLFISTSEDAESERLRKDQLFVENQRLLAETQRLLEEYQKAEAERERAREAELQAIAARTEALRAGAIAAGEAAEAAKLAEFQSRKVARRTMVGLIGVSVLSLMATSIGVLAYVQKNEADTQRMMAINAAETAEAARNQALLSQSRLLTEFSRGATGQDDPVQGLLLAIEALPDITSADSSERNKPYWRPAEEALIDSLHRLRGDQEALPTGQSLIDLAKRIAPRCLSSVERVRYYLPAAQPAWCSSIGK